MFDKYDCFYLYFSNPVIFLIYINEDIYIYIYVDMHGTLIRPSGTAVNEIQNKIEND